MKSRGPSWEVKSEFAKRVISKIKIEANMLKVRLLKEIYVSYQQSGMAEMTATVLKGTTYHFNMVAYED